MLLFSNSVKFQLRTGGGEIRASVSGASGAPGTSGWNANACAQKANIQNNPNGSNTLKKSQNFAMNKVAGVQAGCFVTGVLIE